NSASADNIAGDIGTQTKLCFDHLFEALEAAGLTPDDVVKVNVYLTDMNNFSAMNEVYATKFSKPFPARTCVAVVALPL
ncbi:RidA family protein, partial [Escherichia coli]|uniref:RidA family protein n=1 Tax=Escherichia coli TaxID=562 RepID=UPI001CCE9488